MLTQIHGGNRPPAASLAEVLRAGDSSDAVDLLLGCHTRIRHFTDLAVRLSRGDAPQDQIPAAASAVYRYYSEALPLHEADENESVYPRLRAAAPPDALASANQAMVDQHVAIDRMVAALLVRWRDIQGEPAHARASAFEARSLQAAWEEHLGMEERLIFPALRTFLSADDRLAIRREMQARRQP